MRTYKDAFRPSGVTVAQVLLTRDDLANRRRYLNARNTLNTLLDWKIVPIINENDTVSVEEIKLGDNDNLAAMITLLMDADLLVILSDIDGLFTRDPRTEPDAELIPVVGVITKSTEKAAGSIPGPLGTGGMMSKINAALPAGVKTELGPDASSVGWVFQYALVDTSGKHSLADLRSYQDWYLRAYLKAVPGVGSAEVNLATEIASVTLAAGARVEIPWPAEFNALAYVLAGSGGVGAERRPVRAHHHDDAADAERRDDHRLDGRRAARRQPRGESGIRRHPGPAGQPPLPPRPRRGGVRPATAWFWRAGAGFGRLGWPSHHAGRAPGAGRRCTRRCGSAGAAAGAGATAGVTAGTIAVGVAVAAVATAAIVAASSGTTTTAHHH